MQPFPRREYSATEMNKTLEQLGLVPSGSLVLKKNEADVTQAGKEVQETGTLNLSVLNKLEYLKIIPELSLAKLNISREKKSGCKSLKKIYSKIYTKAKIYLPSQV